jgi:hypothetical protein
VAGVGRRRWRGQGLIDRWRASSEQSDGTHRDAVALPLLVVLASTTSSTSTTVLVPVVTSSSSSSCTVLPRYCSTVVVTVVL